MGEGKWGDVGQRLSSFSYARWISSRDLMYSMVTTANNTVLYTWKLLRKYILSVLTTHKQKKNIWGDGEVNWLDWGNHFIQMKTSYPDDVHLKYMHCLFVSHASIKMEEKTQMMLLDWGKLARGRDECLNFSLLLSWPPPAKETVYVLCRGNGYVEFLTPRTNNFYSPFFCSYRTVIFHNHVDNQS